MQPELTKLGQRWQFDLSLMAGDPQSHLAYSLVTRSESYVEYDGNVDSLKIILAGRWGNYVFQMINMFFIAEELGIKRIYLISNSMFPLQGRRRIGEIEIRNTDDLEIEGSEDRLDGVYFSERPFGRLFDRLTADRRSALARKYVKPLLTTVLDSQSQLSDDDVVIHIRSGDIFEGVEGQGGRQSGGNLYPQPPLSFYLFVIEHLKTRINPRVLIIAENGLNPTIYPLVKSLDHAQVPCRLRLNQSLADDISWFLAAHQMVFANGTIGIALALLSEHLKDAYFFHHRSTGTDHPVEFYLGDVVQTHFAAQSEPYIEVGNWRNDAPQRTLMRDYPKSALSWETAFTPRPDVINVALGKTASQSSTSQFSKPDDSLRAINGTKTGSFAFCTEREPCPWWQVDLGMPHRVSRILIYNRLDVPMRALSMRVYALDTKHVWSMIHDQGGAWFGGIDGSPAIIRLGGKIIISVRIQLVGVEYLHLDQVEVFGHPL